MVVAEWWAVAGGWLVVQVVRKGQSSVGGTAHDQAASADLLAAVFEGEAREARGEEEGRLANRLAYRAQLARHHRVGNLHVVHAGEPDAVEVVKGLRVGAHVAEQLDVLR